MEFYQQGDVLIKRVKTLPAMAEALQTDEAQPVLVRGEITGHAHRVAGSVWMFLDTDGGVFLEAPRRITIVHEEHRPLEIPSGIYRVERVQEFDHLNLLEREVVD